MIGYVAQAQQLSTAPYYIGPIDSSVKIPVTINGALRNINPFSINKERLDSIVGALGSAGSADGRFIKANNIGYLDPFRSYYPPGSDTVQNNSFHIGGTGRMPFLLLDAGDAWNLGYMSYGVGFDTTNTVSINTPTTILDPAYQYLTYRAKGHLFEVNNAMGFEVSDEGVNFQPGLLELTLPTTNPIDTSDLRVLLFDPLNTTRVVYTDISYAQLKNNVADGNNYVTGGSYSNGTLTLNRSGLSDITISGFPTGTGGNYTDSMARAAISLTTTGASGAATYDSTTGVLNIPQYGSGTTVTTSSANTLTLSTSGVYVFTGTTASYTLPTGASGLNYTIKNRGTGALTVSGTMFGNQPTNTITLLTGDAYTFTWDGSYYIIY